MNMTIYHIILFLSFFLQMNCKTANPEENENISSSNQSVIETPIPVPGAYRLNAYTPFLQNKKLGLVVNQSSMIEQTHLVDTLRTLGYQVVRIFSPEHGFRGKADAGEKVSSGIDAETGLQVVSLYGENKKPKPEQIADLDMLIFDLQDVGVRFYTYISTLHYLMEACADQRKPLLILDRPNPNGHYVDGPIWEPEYHSFVGMHPIPVVHGLTVGELAQMINGERWLQTEKKCVVEIVKVGNYTHQTRYELPVKPSPNLPNSHSIAWYPSLCFFEGTNISVGRGTYFPFQVAGYPDPDFGEFTFVPESIPGMAKNPPFLGQTCYGVDLRDDQPTGLTLKYLIDFYHKSKDKDNFFNNYFNTLAGNSSLKQQIKDGKTEEEIRESWAEGLQKYRELRQKYLIYPDQEI
jgi:uncharacterized protein YbbC (DUF1343 family)